MKQVWLLCCIEVLLPDSLPSKSKGHELGSEVPGNTLLMEPKTTATAIRAPPETRL